MSLKKCYVDGKMTSKGRTFCKRILLKEALGGELSSDEIAFFSLLTASDYDVISDELCSEETTFLDISWMLQNILEEEFDSATSIPKEDPDFSEDLHCDHMMRYTEMLDRSNVLLLNRALGPLNPEDLVGSYDGVERATQKGLVIYQHPFPFFHQKR